MLSCIRHFQVGRVWPPAVQPTWPHYGAGGGLARGAMWAEAAGDVPSQEVSFRVRSLIPEVVVADGGLVWT